jgi:hypothetical protein
MGAAVKFSVADFHAVPDDHAPAVLTSWRHRMDRAFKGIECPPLGAPDDLKRLVIVVTANITLSHR